MVAAGFFTGCTSVTYQSHTAAGPAKPPGYPIPIYTEEMMVPRPFEVIGTVSVNAGQFTMFGGGAETELTKVLQAARQKGADAVKLTSKEEPGFTNPNFRLKADLLRYTYVWETIPVSKGVFQAYLNANRRNLDPIEGIWFCDGSNPHFIGIMKNNSKPGRDFVGFILEARDLAWPAGMKKIDIQRGLTPGSYVLGYFREDFERREISIILGQRRSFTLTIYTGDEEDEVNYTKE